MLRVFEVGNPSAANPTTEEDIIEFFGVSALSTLPAEEALARKLPIRGAWLAAEIIGIEHSKKEEKKSGRARLGG